MDGALLKSLRCHLGSNREKTPLSQAVTLVPFTSFTSMQAALLKLLSSSALYVVWQLYKGVWGERSGNFKYLQLSSR